MAIRALAFLALPCIQIAGCVQMNANFNSTKYVQSLPNEHKADGIVGSVMADMMKLLQEKAPGDEGHDKPGQKQPTPSRRGARHHLQEKANAMEMGSKRNQRHFSHKDRVAAKEIEEPKKKTREHGHEQRKDGHRQKALTKKQQIALANSQEEAQQQAELLAVKEKKRNYDSDRDWVPFYEAPLRPIRRYVKETKKLEKEQSERNMQVEKIRTNSEGMVGRHELAREHERARIEGKRHFFQHPFTSFNNAKREQWTKYEERKTFREQAERKQFGEQGDSK